MNKKYFEAQLELEGFKIEGNIIKKLNVNHFDIEKEDKIPSLIALKYNNTIETFYSEELNKETVNILEQLKKETFINNIKEVNKILNSNSKTGNYITYIFPSLFNESLSNTEIILNSDDLKLKEFDESFYKVFPNAYVALDNNKVVSCCVSSRESKYAGEAWVYTKSDYRRKGYGMKAVKLWANELIKQNKIPFYSHEISNISSKMLANKLGLLKLFEIIVYENEETML